MSGQPRRGWRPKRDRGVSRGPAPGDAGTCGADAAVLTVGRAGPGEHVVNVLYGLRAPIVVILLVIAFMASISGKPLDGLLTLIAGVSLAWDTGRRSRARGGAGDDQSPEGESNQARAGLAADIVAGPATAGITAAGATAAATAAEATSVSSAGVTSGASTGGVTRSGATARRRLVILGGLACGAVYALVVGSFTRYSWPATVPVILLGTGVVMIGWRGPRRLRPVSGPVPIAGAVLWGVVFVAGCLWELSSLLEQPNLATSSYTHPTISTLTDPLLSTMTGRAVVLAAWLGLGWFLVER
jgi:hypothetical protein